MKVGDLIKERQYPEVGLIVDIKTFAYHATNSNTATYGVLDPNGNVVWFGPEYIENHCEVVSESR
tara:strand:+ start:208 stop:402 length:195 start_codon:yes stop_codon:yes gene_type:complete